MTLAMAVSTVMRRTAPQGKVTAARVARTYASSAITAVPEYAIPATPFRPKAMTSGGNER